MVATVFLCAQLMLIYTYLPGNGRQTTKLQLRLYRKISIFTTNCTQILTCDSYFVHHVRLSPIAVNICRLSTELVDYPPGMVRATAWSAGI